MLRVLSPTIYRYKQLKSTNDSLKEMRKELSLSEASVVVCDDQTGGRGVDGAWISESEKNLTFSILLNPNFLKVEDQADLNFLVSVSIVEYLDFKGLNPSIKWPNDILIDGKKIAGVLVENTFENKVIRDSIIGIGLNVNQLNFGEFRRQATSLATETNRAFNLQEELDLFLKIILKNYSALPFNKKSLRTKYIDRLYLKGIQSRFQVQDEIIDGVIQGVSSFGLLQLQNKTTNEILNLDLKEVKYLI